MGYTLFVNSCARPDSRTYSLAQHILSKIEGEIREINLYNENTVPLNNKTLEKRTELISQGKFSSPLFKYAKDFAAASSIVIAAPYWDLSFPSVLRIYLEHTTICGITFRYSPEGIPQGLCSADKLIYVTTSGGPIGSFNMGYEYVSNLSKVFYGIGNTLCFKAENLDIDGADTQAILKQAMKNIDINFKG